MESHFIHGFDISHFRSFGDVPQKLGPFKKVNIIIGQNNSGKSNILRFIRDAYVKIVHRGSYIVKDHDQPRNTDSILQFINVTYPVNGDVLNELMPNFGSNDSLIDSAKHIFSYSEEGDGTYIELRLDNYGKLHIPSLNLSAQPYDIQRRFRQLWAVVTSQTGGDFKQHWGPELYDAFKRVALKEPNIHFISAYRKYESRLPEYSQDNGAHKNPEDKTIENLMKLYQPDYQNQVDTKKFILIQDFMREVTGYEHLEIQVPHDLKTVNFHVHDKVLPIEALGTGVHELLGFAVEAVLVEGRVICIEEPELHFHPVMQQKLMRFLDEKTNNQYFITTHSAHIMDAVQNCTVHEVILEDNVSVIRKPINMKERRKICHDLGYKPSDLLQSNCIIWVEGPSDRIYVNHWINLKDPNLREGWHYSVMFYGGKLLSHLTAAEEVDDLINLLSINMNSAIIIDSDKSSARSSLNNTKKRIIEEMQNYSGFSWVTSGREIENYVPEAIRFEAIKTRHGKAKALNNTHNKYSKPLNYTKGQNDEVIDSGFDKVGIAREAIKNISDFDVLDLDKKVEELVDYILKAN